MPRFVAIQREATSCQQNIPAGMKVMVVGVLALSRSSTAAKKLSGFGFGWLLLKYTGFKLLESSGASLLLSQRSISRATHRMSSID